MTNDVHVRRKRRPVVVGVIRLSDCARRKNWDGIGQSIARWQLIWTDLHGRGLFYTILIPRRFNCCWQRVRRGYGATEPAGSDEFW